ncbi:phosphotransferase family protein [Nocardioides limicola]|uniref:phosphotransferase family protein n=1 Tax=Nocardioides limicola TaxID=2803368 RepID=UPI00193B030A|nr:phosphotransferase [Nocardioides sp. DJM-14]
MRPIDSADQITPVWLSEVLGGPVEAVAVERVGSGQIGTCHRVRVSGVDVPASVLVKLPGEDPGARAMLAGAYRSEINFYTRLASTVAIAVPHCYAATEVDEQGRFTLVLEDLAPARQGDQVHGCTPEQARAAAVNLAGLHGPRWCDETLFGDGWLTRHEQADADLMMSVFPDAVDAFLEIVQGRLSAGAAAVVRDCVEVMGDWSLGRAERFGPVHGDYRLDNLMFDPDGSVTAVDWQTLSVGLPARDLAFLLGTGLLVEDRRSAERELVAGYHAALVGHGVTDHSLEECWEDYRYAMLQGVLLSVFGCAYGTRTERGDAMFTAMVERTCAAITDLGSLTLV